MRLKLITYNIHSGIGVDGRYDLGRIEAVLRAEAADVIALQELDCGIARTSFHDQAVVLAQRLGMTSSFCATVTRGEGHFGLATLSRFPVVAKQEYDLTYKPWREPRSCLRVDLELGPGAHLHVFNCHFGLAVYERRYQRRRLLSDAILLSEELHHPVVVMGDFNDRPLSVVHAWLRQHLVDAFRSTGKRNGATFRVGPLGLRLDHIYVSRGVEIADCEVRRDGAAGVASDHRPLVADVEVATE
jgi:endonuclease/exonuclease/phosphatase family metal-dependent hydrolase